MARNDQIKIAAIVNAMGSHIASWRYPSVPLMGAQRLDVYLDLARIAEAGKLDAVFVADSNALNWQEADTMSRTARYNVQFEPWTILSAMAAVTRNLGLVSTSSTTYNEPYAIARKLGSLDVLSGGRGGWNVVTSGNPAEAANFGVSLHPDHAKRYARAHEFIEVVRGLWDSFEDDAFVQDRDAGQYYDPAKLHVLNHKGEHFDVRGPLNLMRPPQGYPVLFQAGASEYGKDLAAHVADAVYSGEPTIEKARKLYTDIKGRMAKYGRQPDQLKMMPGLYVTVGETDEIARAKYDHLNSLIHPAIIKGVVARTLGGLKLDGFELDDKVPDFEDPKVPSSQYHVIARMVREEQLTIRQLHDRLANGGAAHLNICGSPKTVADFMEEAFETRGADGFCLMLPFLPEGLSNFTSMVVPELQRRNLFRTRYEGTTLRESMGLAHPEHPAVAARRSKAV